MNKIYVWNGPKVLKNYRPGLVVIAAKDINSAWDMLKAVNFNAYFWLQTGIRHIFSEDEVWLVEDDKDPDWVVIDPEEYDADSLPALVMFGGE